MAKRVVVIQKNGKCRILVNPDPAQYKKLPHAVDPDLTDLRGVPPEHWSVVGKRVVKTSDLGPKRRSLVLPVLAAVSALLVLSGVVVWVILR